MDYIYIFMLLLIAFILINKFPKIVVKVKNILHKLKIIILFVLMKKHLMLI